ncbi:hypothetical protein N7541_009524 [Penicillium brevicompactum]|uniref:Endonuclease/exonuclease/phosphatase domain-containing protein n=1 Tax=Penicillium brevicompactum TaxID=5074 RepID=A0A9W9UI64_PENBR|nr:hypothetical protein N7541_009524 [Penicillium brevicompactum]
MKSGPRMEALINDHQSQNLVILMIQELSITTYRTHVNHGAWRLYRPTVENLTAIKIWTADQQIIFSVYIPPVPIHNPDGTSAEATLTAIQNIIEDALLDRRKATSIVLSGDFNRHYPSWGGNHIYPRDLLVSEQPRKELDNNLTNRNLNSSASLQQAQSTMLTQHIIGPQPRKMSLISWE